MRLLICRLQTVVTAVRACRQRQHENCQNCKGPCPLADHAAHIAGYGSAKSAFDRAVRRTYLGLRSGLRSIPYRSLTTPSRHPQGAAWGEGVEVPRKVVPDRSDIRRAEAAAIRH